MTRLLICIRQTSLTEAYIYKLSVTVHERQRHYHYVPQYLEDYSAAVSSTVNCQCLHLLLFSSYSLGMFGYQTFTEEVQKNFLCRVTNSAHLVAGPSLLLDQRLGIRCQLTSLIWRIVASLSDVHWKQFCSLSTSVSSALEVFYNDALHTGWPLVWKTWKCQGIWQLSAVREMSGILLKIMELSGKSCLKLFIVNCIFVSIQIFSRSLLYLKF